MKRQLRMSSAAVVIGALRVIKGRPFRIIWEKTQLVHFTKRKGLPSLESMSMARESLGRYACGLNEKVSLLSQKMKTWTSTFDYKKISTFSYDNFRRQPICEPFSCSLTCFIYLSSWTCLPHTHTHTHTHTHRGK